MSLEFFIDVMTLVSTKPLNP